MVIVLLSSIRIYILGYYANLSTDDKLLSVKSKYVISGRLLLNTVKSPTTVRAFRFERLLLLN